MTDNVEKRITISLAGKDDGATATMDRTIAKATELERTFKKVGKITGIGGFRTASDVAEGFTGELGAIGRYAGITAGVAGALTAVNKITGAVDSAVAKLQSGEIAFEEFTNEFVKALPIVGTIQKGLQDTVEIISGVKFAMRDAEASMKAVDERQAIIDQNRNYVLDIVRKANNEADPTRAIKESLDQELDYLKQILDAKYIDEDRYLYAREYRIRKAEEQITDIYEREAEKRKRIVETIADIDRDSLNIRASIEEQSLIAAGNETEAKVKEIRRKADQELADIAKRINDVAMDSSMSQNDAAAISRALQGKAGAVNAQADSDIRRIQEQGRKDAEAARQQAIEKAQRDQDAADRELRDRRVKAIESQQAARTSEFDARGQTGFFNQSKSVTLESINQKTADNTAKTNDKLDKLITTMEQFTRAGGQLIAL